MSDPMTTNQSPEGLAKWQIDDLIGRLRDDSGLCKERSVECRKICDTTGQQTASQIADDLDEAATILTALRDHTGEGDAFPIGHRVSKRSGDYEFDGEIVAVIPKRSGAIRYAVEDDRGLLLVMNARQCGIEDNHLSRTPDREPFDRKAVQP